MRSSKRNYNISDRVQGMKFSIDTIYFKGAFGLHKPWHYIQGKLDEMLEWCPELNIIRPSEKTLPNCSWGYKSAEFDKFNGC